MSLHRHDDATSLHDVLARHRPRITLAVVLLLLTLLAGTALLGLSGHFLTAALPARAAAASMTSSRHIRMKRMRFSSDPPYSSRRRVMARARRAAWSTSSPRSRPTS